MNPLERVQKADVLCRDFDISASDAIHNLVGDLGFHQYVGEVVKMPVILRGSSTNRFRFG
jgi:hypothetical protein